MKHSFPLAVFCLTVCTLLGKISGKFYKKTCLKAFVLFVLNTLFTNSFLGLYIARSSNRTHNWRCFSYPRAISLRSFCNWEQQYSFVRWIYLWGPMDRHCSFMCLRVSVGLSIRTAQTKKRLLFFSSSFHMSTLSSKLPSALRVVAGLVDFDAMTGAEKNISVYNSIIHPSYNSTYQYNDIAIVQVTAYTQIKTLASAHLCQLKNCKLIFLFLFQTAD